MTILRHDNHTLWRRVCHLIRLKHNWEAIAADVGCDDVKALVQWVNDYKHPPKKPLVRPAQMLPITYANKPIRTNREMAAAFLAWRTERPESAKALDKAGL
jgi:hypothetical protein